MSELVEKLSATTHPVEMKVYPEDSVDALKTCIDDGYVHVRFPETRGGTTLGVRLDRDRTDLSQADFAERKGRVVLAGVLTLDFVPVTCHADVDLQTLKGTGRLAPRAE
jgi:hypothetical protein